MSMHKAIPLLFAAIAVAGIAAAGDESKQTEATFKSLDRDADQRLSKTEAASDTMLTEHFTAVDADSDGYLSKREYTAHMKEMDKGAAKKDY